MCSSPVLFEGPLNCAKCAVRRASVLFLKKLLLFFKSCGLAIDLSGFSADVRSFFVGQHTVDRLNTLFHVLKVVLFDHGGSVAVQQIPELSLLLAGTPAGCGAFIKTIRGLRFRVSILCVLGEVLIDH